MEISNDIMVYIAAALVAFVLLKMVKEIQTIYDKYKQRQSNFVYEFERLITVGIAYGEQLIAKHGITDRAQVEALVLKYVNEAMIARGYKPFAREFTEATIRAFIKQSKGG